jgi:tetratricopeptide (TPR) repeat protein
MASKGGALALILLALPSLAMAQKKPSNSMHTRSAEIYLDRATNAQEPERSELLHKSLEILQQGAEADASNPRIWFMMGQAWVRLGNGPAADSAFDQAESMYPDYKVETRPERLALWISQYNRGVAAVQQGDIDQAIRDFEAANAAWDGRPDAQVALGSLYAQKGDLAKAESAYRAALAIVTGPAGDKLDAPERAQWMEQEETAANRLGALLEQTGRADQSVPVYQALVDRQPSNGPARASLAAALARAGRTEEATRIYDRLLEAGDLSDVEWFNAGVRLYSAEQYELAMKAFRKSLEKNPYSRDTMYNFGQAIYAATNALDKQREAGSAPADADARLSAMHRELLDTGAKLRAIDPNFRNAIMMVAQAQRSLADLAGEGGAKEWQDRVVATLQEAQDLPFEVNGIEMRGAQGSAIVSGRLTNLKLPAGQSVNLEFALVGEAGATIATHTVTITTGGAETATPFSFDVKTDGAILGWKYRVST